MSPPHMASAPGPRCFGAEAARNGRQVSIAQLSVVVPYRPGSRSGPFTYHCVTLGQFLNLSFSLKQSLRIECDCAYLLSIGSCSYPIVCRYEGKSPDLGAGQGSQGLWPNLAMEME